jgi:hypothetical protein
MQGVHRTGVHSTEQGEPLVKCKRLHAPVDKCRCTDGYTCARAIDQHLFGTTDTEATSGRSNLVAGYATPFAATSSSCPQQPLTAIARLHGALALWHEVV